MVDLSVIIPLKDERDNVQPLYDRLTNVLAGLPEGLPGSKGNYELVFVDDGSSDGTYSQLAALANRDGRVKVIRLRRNFGQSAALQAGIDGSSGLVLITMDGDLQNDPSDIPVLLNKLAEGYDAVLGERADRHDGFLLRKLPSWCANWLIRRVSGCPWRDFGCTMRAMRRDLADSLPLYGEMHRFIPLLAMHYGANIAQVGVRHHPRTAGKSKYNLTRTVRVLLDLVTIQFLHGYLTRPMHFLGTAGLGLMFLGSLSLAATVLMKYSHGTFMTGNPLLLLSVMLELIGVQFICLGLLGEVLVRTYFESQGKVAYAVRDTLNTQSPTRKKAA